MAIEKLIGPKEAGDVLAIKTDTLYKWTAEGKIPFLKIGGALRFRPSALQAWIQEREHAATNVARGRGVMDILADETGSVMTIAGPPKKDSRGKSEEGVRKIKKNRRPARLRRRQREARLNGTIHT
jgi:excisionase family DNA binding protein